MYFPLRGAPPSAFRDVAFIYAGTTLPTVSVVSRAHHVGTSRVGMFGPFVGWLETRAARAAAPRAPADSDVMVRLDGWPVGTEELRRDYKVEAIDREHAEWLVRPALERALLADTTVSLASIGADVMAWCDRGYLSTPVVDALVGVLDAVGLAATE
jgi:hypothetical protein